MKYMPLLQTAYGLRNIRFVEEDFDKGILITFRSKLQYPGGYAGFSTPNKVLTPAEAAKLEARRLARERRAKEAAAKAVAKAQVRAEKEAEANAAETESQIAQANPTPTPKPEYPGGFGKINTAPIKAQVQRLYDAKQEGKLVMPAGKLKVGVSGSIRADGTLANCRVIIPSGLEEIDRAALAILNAVSASRALGPLHEITSLSMILTVDERAELTVVGFTPNDQAAANIVNLANTAILFARLKKADDPAAMVMINNLKVFRTGQRVQAVISVPRDKASATMTQTFAKNTQ
ncbi:MAG: hypothetical protein HOP19_19950 [Acidobacteria bacterium]|nr:hypothetical protein [Acidobacteriota bacterium]